MAKKTYLDFINCKKQYDNDLIVMNEAFESNKIENVLQLAEDILRKHLDDTLLPLVGFSDTTIDGESYKSKEYIVTNKSGRSMMFTLNWKVSERSSEIYSVSFFRDMSLLSHEECEPTSIVNTQGISIVKILPLIWEAINNDNYDFSENFVQNASSALNSSIDGVKECIYDAYYARYILTENISDMQIANEAGNADAYAKIKSKKEEIERAKAKGDKALVQQLFDEYAELIDAVYKDNAKSDEEIRVSVERRKKMKDMPSASVRAAEREFGKNGRKSPEQVFKEMRKYTELVIKGIQNSVIICGAPGVGKSYRVKEQLRDAGYKEGVNMYTYKGKGTPRALYLTLYNYRHKGDIIVIDDADALVGPKAPEDSINILKAALDTTSDKEGRLVNYGIATKLVDDEGNHVDKKFYYNGGIIVITNYNAGQLDSALRGRSFIQDINFTIEETLQVIKSLMPNIEPELYSKDSKIKAYKFLEELSTDKEYEMNISVRIFCLCAKLFESCANDDAFDDDDVKSMIKEQMKNQSADGGKKY